MYNFEKKTRIENKTEKEKKDHHTFSRHGETRYLGYGAPVGSPNWPGPETTWSRIHMTSYRNCLMYLWVVRSCRRQG